MRDALRHRHTCPECQKEYYCREELCLRTALKLCSVCREKMKFWFSPVGKENDQ